MRILQIASHMNVGGITRYVVSLSKRLARRNHRVIVASESGPLLDQVRTTGLVHWPVPLRTSAEFSPQVLYGIRRLLKLLRQEPVDIIHAHTRVAQIVADRISKRLNIPYVTTWHGIYKRRFGRRLWPCAGEMTIAISEPVRQHLRQDFRIPVERVRLVYNGIETAHYATAPEPSALQAYRARWRIPENDPIIGGIGRLAAGRVKGFDSLLVIAHLLKESVPTLRVLMVGDGPRRPFLEDVARRLGVQDRVHFVGEAGDIRVPLALMDLFVFPSRWPEAFGLTLVEAMAAGKPIIATQVGAVPEIVRHGMEGWLVPPEDPSAMAEAVVRLLRDRPTAHRFGRQAQMRAHEAFDLDRMVVEVEDVYREVAGRYQKPPARDCVLRA